MVALTFIENNDSFSWNVIDLLPVSRSEVEIVRGGTAEALAAVGRAEAVIIGPGPGDPRGAGLLELVRLAAARGVPLLGICLGHQAIGVAFGAELHRSSPVHGHVAPCDFEPSRSFAGISGRLQVMRYHSLSLERVVSPLRVVARAEGRVMAIEHETLPIAGLQFHPDSYATVEGRRLIEAFLRSSGRPNASASPSPLPRTPRTNPNPLASPVPRTNPNPLPAPRPSPSPSLSAVPVPEPEALRLSTLEARDAFILFGPGFTGGGWALLDPSLPATATALLSSYSDRAPREVKGGLTPIALTLDVGPSKLAVELDERGFLSGVDRIHDGIAAGDVYQVNLTQRASVTCGSGASLLTTLCHRGLPRFAAWVKLPGLELVSASPELLFEQDGGTVRVEPMKGTAAPDGRAWLEASAKDRAELAMITDLLRDDLQHLCAPRSIRVVNERRFIELPYALQTVSDIEGVLREGVGVREILSQLHPGGSVTGAPRGAACDFIARLEHRPRGFYCGALGLVRGDRARFALLIRSATRVAADRWEYGVGSGITWSSDPQAELEEVRLKLGALA